MIEAKPKVIVFDSITPGKLYLMTLSLTNTSSKAQRIRIRAPSSDFFALNYIPTRSIAPGLDIRAEVECQLPLDAINSSIGFTDRLIVTMGEHTLEIPIIASKPHSVLVHSPFINYGDVSYGNITQSYVKFMNQGSVDGKVTFKIRNKSAVSITPTEIDLKPNQTVEAILKFNSEVPIGSYRDIIEVNMSKALKSSSVIDVIASVLESKLTLFSPHNEGILQNIDFGLVYYGHSRTIKATLVNSGSQPLSYRFLQDMMEPVDDPTTNDNISKSRFVSFTPNEGIAPPFSEQIITIVFHPELIKPTKGFSQHFTQIIRKPQALNYDFIFETLELNQKHYFTSRSEVMNPTLVLDHQKLFFGKCSSNDRRDIRVSIYNPSPTPLEFQFSRHPYFKFLPSSGKILQYQSISVICNFLPLQLGVFQETLQLSVVNSSSSIINFVAYGEANEIGPRRVHIGGTDKLPEDFRDTYKFVDQDIESAKFANHKNRTFHPSVTKSMNIMNSAKTLSSDMSISSVVSDPVFKKLNLATESHKEVSAGQRFVAFNERRMEQLKVQQLWDSKKQDDQRYNDYLQDSHSMRLAMTNRKSKEKHDRMKIMDDIVLDY